MSDGIVIIGAGGHGCVVASVLQASGRKIEAFYDDDPSIWKTEILGVPVRGPVSRLHDATGESAILAVGDNRVRQRLARELPVQWTTAIHPAAWIHPEVKIGQGTVVCAGAIVQPRCGIGEHVILNTRSSVDHDSFVGDFSHLAVAHLAGNVRVGVGTFAACGSVVLPGVTVGAWATIGAGATVLSDVADGLTVVGTPARPLSVV